MYTEEEFIELEQEEREITDEEIAIMLLLLDNIHGNLETELRAFYQKYGVDGVVTYAEAQKWVSERKRKRRLAVLALFITGEFISALAAMEQSFNKFLNEVANKEITFFGVKLDVEKVLEKRWGLDNKNWLQRLEDDVNLWNAQIIKEVKLSILRGENINTILKRLDKRFKSIGSVLTSLGLSESTAIGSLTRQQIFKELGITKYKFYTKVDERRCEECGSLHGKIFPMSSYEVGVNASPIHPRCRCWEVPVLK